jgi:hypothetical protein
VDLGRALGILLVVLTGRGGLLTGRGGLLTGRGGLLTRRRGLLLGGEAGGRGRRGLALWDLCGGRSFEGVRGRSRVALALGVLGGSGRGLVLVGISVVNGVGMVHVCKVALDSVVVLVVLIHASGNVDISGVGEPSTFVISGRTSHGSTAATTASLTARGEGTTIEGTHTSS